MILPEYERIAQRTDAPSSAAANLPAVEEADATGEVAELYSHFRSHFGRSDVPGILKCFATHPPLLQHMMALSEGLIFTDGSLVRRHKEMIATLVSSENDCPYCADSHGYFLRVHGGSPDALCAIQSLDLDSPGLTEAEQALLSFASKVNLNSHEVTADDITRLEQAGWSSMQAAEAVHIVALFATFNRVANAFGLQSQGLLRLYES